MLREPVKNRSGTECVRAVAAWYDATPPALARQPSIFEDAEVLQNGLSGNAQARRNCDRRLFALYEQKLKYCPPRGVCKRAEDAVRGPCKFDALQATLSI